MIANNSIASITCDAEPTRDQSWSLARLPGWALSLRREHEQAKLSGNTSYITTTGLRVAVCSGDPDEIAKYLLNEMGISATARRDAEGILLGFRRFDLYSAATITRALHGQFRVLGAMAGDGTQALKIYL